MKIIIEHDDKKKQVFQYVTDAYIALRQFKPKQNKQEMAILPETKSYSWGLNLRELIKELRQSLVELEVVLKDLQSGNHSN